MKDTDLTDKYKSYSIKAIKQRFGYDSEFTRALEGQNTGKYENRSE